MRTMALILSLSLATPAVAQEAAPKGEAAEGFSLMEEGARLLLRGLMREMEPALDEMGEALRGLEPGMRELGPRLRQLVDLMGDVANYEAPERLGNGDILIRRKPGAPPPPALPDPLPESPPEARPEAGPEVIGPGEAIEL